VGKLGQISKEELKNRAGANSGKVAYVPAFVAELYDSRLTSDEKVLLWMIRYRAGASGRTWISWDTLIKQSGQSKPSVMRRLNKLKKLGFLKTSSRGFGNSTFKIVECPTALYPADLCDSDEVSKYFKGPDADGWLDELQSKSLDYCDNSSSPAGDTTVEIIEKNGGTKLLDDCEVSSSLTGETTVEIIEEIGPIDDCNNSSSLTGDTSLVSPVRLELNKFNYKKPKKPKTASLRSSGTPSGIRDDEFPKSQKENSGKVEFTNEGESYNPETGEILESSEGPTPIGAHSPQGLLGDNSDSDDRAAIARAAIASAARRTDERSKAVKLKREAKKARERRSGASADKEKAKAEAEEKPKKPSVQLEEHCRRVFGDYFPFVNFGKWMRVEYSQANKLLDAYEDDLGLVKEAWDYSCENWDALKTNFKLTGGHPNIGWLLAFRERIFPFVQKIISKREDIESDQLKNTTGWD